MFGRCGGRPTAAIPTGACAEVVGHAGYEPTREAAMAAFAKSWRRE
jgi:hypothetical protein